MIFTYRKTSYNGEHAYSRVLGTYKDVTSVDFSKAGIAVLFGTIPAMFDAKANTPPFITRYEQVYIIAAIKLGEGDRLEREDLPRD